MELFAYRDDVDKYGKSWIELFLYCEAIYLNTQPAGHMWNCDYFMRFPNT